MLGFIIPFKSKAKSQNWEKDCFLLKQTIFSICNQLNNEYKVFVVYSDLPTIDATNGRVSFINYPFTFLTVNNIDDYEDFLSKHFSDRIGELMFDQGKKILWGCSHAIQNGCHFVMSVDADDLVSNKISEFVAHNRNEQFGWYIDRGFILRENSRFLIKVNKDMNHINGSTNIVNARLVPNPNFESKNLEDFTFFSSHGYLKDRIKYAFNDTLKPLPFYALIYYVHQDNWSSLGNKFKSEYVKTFFKYLLRGKYLSRLLKREFGLYPIE